MREFAEMAERERNVGDITPLIPIFNDIRKECYRQDAKWGVQNHTPEAWLAILMEEVGEVAREVTRQIPPIVAGGKDEPPDPINYRHELVQSAAVLVRMIECWDRQL